MTEQLQSLDYQLIEKASEKFENIREVVVHMEIGGDIKEFLVEIHKHFSPVSVKLMVQELIEKLDRLRVREQKQWNSLIVPYTIFLTIKHFTTLKLPNTYAEQLKAIEHMMNTGTLFQIFMAFEESEIEKMKEEVQFVLDNFNKNMESVEEFKTILRESLVDKSLLE